jgi:hypothetical protein
MALDSGAPGTKIRGLIEPDDSNEYYIVPIFKHSLLLYMISRFFIAVCKETCESILEKMRGVTSLMLEGS